MLATAKTLRVSMQFGCWQKTTWHWPTLKGFFCANILLTIRSTGPQPLTSATEVLTHVTIIHFSFEMLWLSGNIGSACCRCRRVGRFSLQIHIISTQETTLVNLFWICLPCSKLNSATWKGKNAKRKPLKLPKKQSHWTVRVFYASNFCPVLPSALSRVWENNEHLLWGQMNAWIRIIALIRQCGWCDCSAPVRATALVQAPPMQISDLTDWWAQRVTSPAVFECM